jgi:tetratricopeptide (TPR) repeat protein/TolB-like protein
MTTLHRSALAAALLVTVAVPCRAQCPDGAPPPCKGAVPAAIRRVNPPLNPRAWIVVPFGNVMKAQELDWLRDASVNLLTLDMSRWTDVSVVPDKRVGDLVRESSGGKSADALTLSQGIAIARRAGAGRLVMGDFFRLGKGARVVANVFDVSTGAKMRTVTQQAQESDSLLTAFGPLARGVLAVPPPPDAKTGDVGTQNLDAYQAYLLGVKALNKFDLPEARKQLTRALSLDSTFALAHLQYSLLLAWGDAGTSEAKTHALDAQRLGAKLPRRERMIIDARVASVSEDYARSCEIARPLVALDSTDIQSLYLLGECSYHDNTVDPLPDGTTGTFRNSWNTALRSFTKILELDPSYLGAFEHVLDILQAPQRSGRTCAKGAAPLDCTVWYSMLLRSGDSLETVPVRSDKNDPFFAQQDRGRKEKARLTNLQEATSIAERWINADSSSEGAHLALGRVLLARGDVVGADAHLKRTSVRATQDNFSALRTRMEVDAKLGRGADARAMFDSLVKAVPDIPSIAVLRGSMELMFGRMTRLNSGLASAATRLGPAAITYQRQVPRAILGVPREDLLSDEAAFYQSMRDSTCVGECRLRRMIPTLSYSLHKPAAEWGTPAALKAVDGRLTPAGHLTANDTTALRKSAASLERSSRSNIENGLSEYGWSLISADAYLALNDTASALRMTRFFVDTAMNYMPVIFYAVPGVVSVTGSGLWARGMLQRANLAAATGQREEARKWYARVLDLWANADPELQPTIARIHSSLAALGPPGR